MSEDKQQEEFDLIGNILSEDGDEDSSPNHDFKKQEKLKPSTLMNEKCSSAPANVMKARFDSRQKGSHSPQKSPTHLPSGGYTQNHNVHYGSYSPEKPKFHSNLYPNEFYAQPNNGWQATNPQIVNMNSEFANFNLNLNAILFLTQV